MSNTPLISSTESNKTLAIDDASIVQRATATLTYTIPPNSSVPYPIGTIIPFLSDTTGTVTIAPGSGVTLLSPVNQSGSRTLVGRYARAAALKIATDTWSLAGDLA